MTLKQLASSTAFLIRINLVVAYLLDARLALLLLRWISFALVCFVVAAKNLRYSLIWIALLNALAILLHLMGDPPSSPSSYLVLDFVGSTHTSSLWRLLAVDLVTIALQVLAAFATYLDQIPGYRARWDDQEHASGGGQAMRGRFPTSFASYAPINSDGEDGVGWNQEANDESHSEVCELVMDVTLGDIKRAWAGDPPRNDADFHPA